MDRHTDDVAGSPGPVARTFDDVWADDRGYVLGIASRMLGDHAAAEDVVQETFSRLALVSLDELDDVRGWLVVVARRLCLDRIRSAHTRREAAAGDELPETDGTSAVERADDPADRVTLDDQVQRALAVVLDRLTPAERTAFVLHDVFGFPYDAIADIVGRTPVACRQLASRARRSIRNGPPASRPSTIDDVVVNQRVLTERFIAACAGGDLGELMEVLDPDIVGVAALIGSGRKAFLRVQGRPLVARRILDLFGPGKDRTMVPVSVERKAGVVAFDGGRVAAVLVLGELDGRINHIDTYVNGLTLRTGRAAPGRTRP